MAISHALAPLHVGFPPVPTERDQSTRRLQTATGQETGLPAEGRRGRQAAPALRGELLRGAPRVVSASLGADEEGMAAILPHPTRIYVSPLTAQRGIDVYRTLQDTTGLVDEYPVFRVDVYV